MYNALHQDGKWPLSCPLAVDLDGALITADSLFEMIIVGLLRQPKQTAVALLALFWGRSVFKEKVAQLGTLDAAHLPLRDEFVVWLREQKRQGRKLHLVTAAWQTVADGVAHRLDLFDSVTGSSAGLNRKGSAKRAFLEEKFPEGYSYAGDSAADLVVWRGAKSIVLVGASKRVVRAAEKIGIGIEARFERQSAVLWDWIRELRLHQWTKNLLLFVPVILAHRYNDLVSLIHCLLGFLCLGLVASGTYVINDISDVATDRSHRTKCRRPIARGVIGPVTALAASLALILAGLAGAEVLKLGHSFGITLIGYLILTLSYSMRFKLEPLIDAFILGLLYTLRVLMGIFLIAVTISPWILVFSVFFFFSLSMAKRHVEIVRAVGEDDRDITIKGRGYRASDAPFSLGIGLSTGVASVLILFLYIVNDAYPVGSYRHPQWLWGIGLVVFLWMSRIWLLSHRSELDDDPVVFAIGDPVSLFLGAVVCFFFVMAVL